MLNVKTTQGLAIIRQGRADPLMRGLTAMAALISGMCAFLAVKRVLKDTRLINLALKSWIMGAICTILVGGYQFAHYYVHALPGLPLTAALGVRGLGIADRDVTATGQSSEFMIRMASFAMEPRHLAYLLTPVLCFLLVYLLGSPDLTRSTRRKTLLVTGLIIIGFGLTASRSTYILGIVAFGVTLWGARRRLLTSAFRIGRSLVLLGLGTALILGTLAMITGYNPLEFVRLQLASLAQVDNPGSGVPYGIDAFVLAWLMFKSNPFIGAGWGSYVYAVQKYPLAFALQANPNNLYLLMLGETGLIGLCALLWVFWRGLRMSHISLPAARKHAPLLAALGAALLATYAGFMFWDSIQYTHLWMLLGLMQAARRAAIREPLCA
jgi:O-antigen ligase